MNCKAAVILALALCCVFALEAAAQQFRARKKLIEYGWDVPTAAFVREHIREMERRPFDGLIFQVPDAGRVFIVQKWDEAKFAAALEDLRNIQWGKFTDNFIITWAASTMDWFSDDDWQTVLHNLGLMARAAADGRCKGLCFDPEPYGDNPWAYPNAVHPEKSFADYQAQARKRGAQFMRAITAEMPNAVVHTFFLLSLFPQVAGEPDPAQRAQLLSRHQYALLPAFLNGMLDAAGPNVVITDGNESSYYYTDPCAYYRAYHLVRQTALSLVAPENVRTYDSQVQMSQALYVDQVFNLRQGMKLLSSTLSPEERARWFEQDVYYALATADEYVWCYSERMNWWLNQDLPPGLSEAIESARTKIVNREPLGFDLADELKAAEERLRAELESKIVRRTAEIPRRPADVAAPVIDGKLDDPIWRGCRAGGGLPPLALFLPYLTSPSDTVQAATQVRAAYDDENLYLACKCDEPDLKSMRVLGSRRDDPGIWLGDSIDIFLSVGAEPTPFVHFILNPANLRWDAYCRTREDEDLSFDPDWRSATSIGEDAWFAEIALPWAQIRVPAPPPGATHRAQVGRSRTAGDEHSTWSQAYLGFVYPEYFGAWLFR